jgi:hypothetical protein
MNDIDPNQAIDYIKANAPLFAQAKADRVHLENYLKVVKAEKMNESDSSTQSGKETDAYASQAYKEILNGLKVAVEQEEKVNYLLKAAFARIDIWKTMEYSKRQELKTLGG